MKKIMLIPLDERPCNYDFPPLMAKASEYELIMPPREILGQKKLPGDVNAIWNWVNHYISHCDAAILSIDTLLYSGIVPSRLHYQTEEQLLIKLEQLKTLKEQNPNLILYAFNLIMRNPQYSSSEEEPDYYADYGREIFLYGSLGHKCELKIATEKEIYQLEEIAATIPSDILSDYLTRRKKNICINKRVIELASEGIFDFVIIPQDDASPYGLTAKDQQVIRRHIEENRVNTKVYMYPDADAVANTLLIRYINFDKQKRPLVYIKYTSGIADGIIPLYEDRTVNETIKYQILAAGGLIATSITEADLILMINLPSGNMQDRLSPLRDGNNLPRTIEYDACRNLIEVIEFADYSIKTLDKKVIFGDIAYANGGDPLLFEMLKEKHLLYKLSGYAGWNTSSNTLGTCIPMGMFHYHYGTTDAHLNFLMLRYIEDIAYCSNIRQILTDQILDHIGLEPFILDGQHGLAANIIKQMLQSFVKNELDTSEYQTIIHDCYVPWNRVFEIGLNVECKKI